MKEVQVVPAIVGALRNITKNLYKFIKKTG